MERPAMNTAQAMRLIALEDDGDLVFATVQDAEGMKLNLKIGRQVAQRFPIGATIYVQLVLA